jgi:hypothetical protein
MLAVLSFLLYMLLKLIPWAPLGAVLQLPSPLTGFSPDSESMELRVLAKNSSLLVTNRSQHERGCLLFFLRSKLYQAGFWFVSCARGWTFPLRGTSRRSEVGPFGWDCALWSEGNLKNRSTFQRNSAWEKEGALCTTIDGNTCLISVVSLCTPTPPHLACTAMQWYCSLPCFLLHDSKISKTEYSGIYLNVLNGTLL